MLLALTGAFSMSQAFRTVAAILAKPLEVDFGLSARELGVFAGSFHFAFGAMQLFVGIGIDLYGVRRTLLAAFPLTVAGSLLAALAESYGALVAGQVLIGLGCAPAFLVCTVFIARHFPTHRFAAYSGLVMALGGVGLLFTGTPLAWMVDQTSWRTGFWVLGAGSVLAWFAVLLLVDEPRLAHGQASAAGGAPSPMASPQPARPESVREALQGYAELLRLPHTWGILLLAAVGYASFLTLRGLWLGPLLIERHAYSLVHSGHVALVVSLVSLFGPPLFGRLDPGAPRRRRWLVGFSVAYAALFLVLAAHLGPAIDVALLLLAGVCSGYLVLQYPDVREAYPPQMTGRALSVFTMAMFLGVAAMQWFTGVVASVATGWGWDPFTAVPVAMAFILLAGTGAFALLPAPPAAAGRRQTI